VARTYRRFGRLEARGRSAAALIEEGRR
jgi:hypothetical protein